MRRISIEQVSRRIQSRQLARALRGIGPVGARTIRATWTATARRFGTGRYRWHRKGLRAELLRLAVLSQPWYQPMCA